MLVAKPGTSRLYAPPQTPEDPPRRRNGCAWVILLIALVVGSTYSGVRLYLITPPRTVQQATQVRNYTVYVSGLSNSGSGFLVQNGDHTFVWTAAHVVREAALPDGTFEEFTIKQGDVTAKARVLAISDCNQRMDCALLEVLGDVFDGSAKLPERDLIPQIGSSVIACGAPTGLSCAGTVSFGYVSNVDRELRYPFIRNPVLADIVTLAAAPGSSGGPVVDASSGCVVGMVVLGHGPGFIVTQPIRHVQDWAEKNGLLWALDPRVPVPSWRPPVHSELPNGNK